MFAHFSLHRQLLKSLREMGIRTPTPVQAEAIPLVMDGTDLQVAAETGSGKTIAYLAPTLHRLLTSPAQQPGIRLLILLPTRELAQQVFKACEMLIQDTPLTAALIVGGEEMDEQSHLLTDDTPIVVATTGRLMDHLEGKAVDLSALEVLVLDEADRMLDMGFSKDVATIGQAANPERQTLLFSATMESQWFNAMASKVLREPEILKISGGRSAHSNITEQVMLADNQIHKQKLLLWLLSYEKYNKAIIFTNSRDRTDQIGNFIIQKKHKAAILHGGITAERRSRVMEMVEDGILKIIVATDVAARGLDIEGLDLVINFDMPRRGDDYVHRIGRTGRGEEQGLSITMVQPNEWNLKASVERYLKHKFEPRVIEALQGEFTGPKNLKASGKTVGTKKKKEKVSPRVKKAKEKAKQRKRDKQNKGKRNSPNKTSTPDTNKTSE